MPFRKILRILIRICKLKTVWKKNISIAYLEIFQIPTSSFLVFIKVNKDQSFLFSVHFRNLFYPQNLNNWAPRAAPSVGSDRRAGKECVSFPQPLQNRDPGMGDNWKSLINKRRTAAQEISTSLWWFQKMQWSVCTKMNTGPLRTLTWRSLVKRTSLQLFPTMNLGATQLVSPLIRKKRYIFISPPCV